MNPPAISTPCMARRSCSLLDDIHADGTTIVMVTHSPSNAARAARIVSLLDGAIQ